MKQHRYVEEERLVREVDNAVKGAVADYALPDEEQEKIRRVVMNKVTRFLLKQPTAPRLVSVTGAAKILSVAKPYIVKLRNSGRFPEGIPVEDSAAVYIREEVEALRPELDATRARRGITKEDPS